MNNGTMSNADLTPPEPSEEKPEQRAAPQPAGIVIEAIYRDGVIVPLTPLPLPDQTRISLAVDITATAVVQPLQPQPAASNAAPAPPAETAPAEEAAAEPEAPLVTPGVRRPALAARAGLLITAAVVLFYLFTRLYALNAYPIYFFSDEAIQATTAYDFLQSGLRDNFGTFLPPFFRNADRWNLSLSIYIHSVSVALFGVSIFVTRATSVVVSVLAVVAVMLTLRLFFNVRLWWAGALVLAAMPAWFTHSRTAFETVMMVAFYACFLCSYLMYRYRSPRYLPLAVLFGAATFYSYTNGQGVMLVSGGLLFLVDIRYHIQQRRALLLGILLAALLALPLVRFFQLQPDGVSEQLRLVDSVWTRDIPTAEKITTFLGNYFTGLSPLYWFTPNSIDFERHRMKDIAHVPTILFPFALIGFVACIRRWRSPAHRVVLIAMLAAPFTAAFSGIFVTRTLAMVVPLALLITLGLDEAVEWLRRRAPRIPYAPAVAALLVALNLGTMRAALVDGPTWFSDYGLHGMQWGTEQLFTVIPPLLEESPDTRLLISPNWSNNADIFLRFFLDERQRERVRFGTIDPYANYKQEIDPHLVFVMPPDEYQRASTDPKFVISEPQQIIPYPDGRPGFYFVHARYSDTADAIFAAEIAERRRLREGSAAYAGQEITIRHSLLDGGSLPDLFDGDPFTLIRGFEANPFILELTLPEARSINEIALTVATMDFSVTTVVTGADSIVRTYEQRFTGLPPDPQVVIALPDAPPQVRAISLTITDLKAGDRANIHIRELALR